METTALMPRVIPHDHDGASLRALAERLRQAASSLDQSAAVIDARKLVKATVKHHRSAMRGIADIEVFCHEAWAAVQKRMEEEGLYDAGSDGQSGRSKSKRKG